MERNFKSLLLNYFHYASFSLCLSVEFHASCLPLAACEVSNLRSAAYNFQFYYFSPSSSLFSLHSSPLASVIIYWVFHSRSVVFLEHFIHNTVSRSAGIWLAFRSLSSTETLFVFHLIPMSWLLLVCFVLSLASLLACCLVVSAMSRVRLKNERLLHNFQ